MKQAHHVNAYDFDHTIYSGDSSYDFIWYCLSRDAKLWRYMPGIAATLVRYVLGLTTRKKFKESAFSFLSGVKNIDEMLELFWSRNEKKIAPWYRENHQKSDIIISASPEFLLAPIAGRLGVDTVLGTKMNKLSGHINGENCRGEEKVRRLREAGLADTIDAAYSDSLADLPLLTLARRPFMVKKNTLVKLEDHKPSSSEVFKDVAFLRFLFVGCINAALGVVFSYVISLMLQDPLIAFVLGYTLSLVISYFLNSVVTFGRYDFSFRQFVSFVVSYIPNFLIQVVVVRVLITMVGLNPLATYILAVLIAVPVTFLLLSKRTFKDKDGVK
jgi:HAD superfamily phosphoserine phosphatase-like hydrolase